jgi:WXG100 family type VII secretion target
MFSGIFKLMFQVVEGAISQIINQAKIIEDAVTNPLKTIVSQVTGGIWKGDGADRFVEEMSNEVIPSLVNIMNVNQNYASAIRRSVERMQQAEQQAAHAAQTLHDVFGQIY